MRQTNVIPPCFLVGSFRDLVAHLNLVDEAEGTHMVDARVQTNLIENGHTSGLGLGKEGSGNKGRKGDR